MEQDIRPIPGWAGYLASSGGVIFSDKGLKRRTLKQRDNGVGYRTVNLSTGPPRYGVPQYVHRLVLLAFCGEPEDAAACTRHLDGDNSNNSLDNLRWGTYKENEADKKRHGRTACGERSGRARWTAREILAMRRAYAFGPHRQVKLAQLFGMRQAALSGILSGRIWRSVISDEPRIIQERINRKTRKRT